MIVTEIQQKYLRDNNLTVPESIENSHALTGVVVAILRRWVWVSLIAAGTAFATFVVCQIVPQRFTSSSFLTLSPSLSKEFSARTGSSPLLDEVMAPLNVPGETIEARRRYLIARRSLTVIPGSTVNRFDTVAGSPLAARETNERFLTAWLDSTKPQTDRRESIEIEAARLESQTKAISLLIDRLEKETPIVLQNSLQGELATPLTGLITRRDSNIEKLQKLQEELKGVSRDVVFGAPTLPEEASFPQTLLFTAWGATVGAVIAILLFGFLGWWRSNPLR